MTKGYTACTVVLYKRLTVGTGVPYEYMYRYVGM